MNELPIFGGHEEEKTSLTRRGFLGQCASIIQGITLVGVIAPVLASCGDDTTTNPGTVDTGDITFDVKSLTTDGQGLLTTTKGSDQHTVMIVRISSGQYKALSTRCTHEACDVNLPSGGSIICPCHGSKYNLDGSLVNGPAPSPLKSYQLTYNATDQTVTVTVT